MEVELDFRRLEALILAGQLQEFYSEIKSITGFKYCDLALGIVTGDSVAGEVAVKYMRDQALDKGINLGDAQVENVKIAMANGYLDALESIAETNSGKVNRDISASEALTLHNQAFSSLGLPVECWTLYVPFNILSSEDAQENWVNFLDNAATTNAVSDTNLVAFLDTYFGNTFETFWEGSARSVKSLSFSDFWTVSCWIVSNGVNLVARDDLSKYFREQVLQVQGVINAWGASYKNDVSGENLFMKSNDFFLGFTTDQINSLRLEKLESIGSLSEIVSAAKIDSLDGRAIRNALKYSSPLIVYPDEGFSGRGLGLYDELTGAGVLTDKWISDRAAMVLLALEEARIPPGTQLTDINATEGYDYKDLTTGVHVTILPDGPEAFGAKVNRIYFGSDSGETIEGKIGSDHLYGMAGNDTLLGDKGNDYLEGGGDNDFLDGGADNDTLRGMSGDDELVGGSGFDYLDGGFGNDTYVFTSGFGSDTIVDIDGAGSIKFDGALLTGGTSISENTYFNKDSGWSYVRSNGDLLLTRSGPSNSIRIVGWREGDLGIHLENAIPAVPPVSTNDPILGDRKVIDFDPTQSGDQVHINSLGNVEVNNNIIDANREDFLYDGIGNDQVFGYGGNDTIKGSRTGDDLLDGGSGDDWVDTTTGADTLIGGQGSDRVSGGSGNNFMYGDERLTDQQVIASNTDTQSVLSRGDLVNGNGGNDLIAGSVRNDLLMGGSGRDSLYGAGGNDVIYGDRATSWLTENWQVTRTVTVVGDVANYLVDMQGMDNFLPNATDDDRDFLFGGAGDDWLFGETGQDYLEGNAGADVLFGGKDNDVLIGGEGNDTLAGDEGVTPTGQDGNDLLSGEAGDDRLSGDGGNDTLYGGADNDTLVGDNTHIAGSLHGNDVLDGGSGNDTLMGLGGSDTLDGGADNDLLYGDDIYHEISSDFYGRDVLRGGQGNDSLYGGGGADELRGGSDNDVLVGDGSSLNVDVAFQGDDSLYGEQGNDSLFGNGGNDLLDGGSESDNLVGGEGNDTLLGDSGDDYLYGEAGNDVLTGGSGVDYFDGGLGNDTYRLSASDVEANSQETIRDAGGIDTLAITGQLSADISGNDGSLFLLVGNASERRQIFVAGGLFGAIEKLDLGNGSIIDLRDWVNLNLTQALELTTEHSDLVFSGAGDDTITATRAGVTIDAGRGSDTIILSNAVTGGATVKFALGDGVDVVQGAVTADPLATRQNNIASFGTGIAEGSLRLLGSFGEGGASNLYVGYGGGGDRIRIDLANDGINVSRPFDRFDFEDGSSVLWDQLAELGVTFNAPLNSSPVTTSGTILDDRITGGAGNDYLAGGLGDDYLNGAAGNDTLTSTLGVDTLVGGAGDDVLTASSVDGTVLRFNLGDGADSFSANYAFSNARSGENILELGEGISLESLQLVQVSAGNYQLRMGAGGDNIKFSMLGSDLAGGSRPFDKFVFSNGQIASWQQLVDRGVDINVAQASGVAALGTNLNDRIVGNFGSRTIDAGAGNDFIQSGGGNEVLIGGSGNDSYLFSTGFGSDVVNNSTALSSDTDRIIFSNAVQFSDARFSRAADDLLVFFVGRNDTLRVAGFFTNSGTETIEFADGHFFDRAHPPAYSLSLQNLATENDDSLTLTSGADIFDALGGSDNISGAEGNDTVKGGDGNDTLRGDAGNDWLEGGEGNDSIVGGAGDDTLYGGDGNDYIYGEDTTSGSTGNDVIYGGNGNDAIFGRAGADLIYGEAGDDYVMAENGDTVRGGLGDDLIRVDAGQVAIKYGIGDGADTYDFAHVQFDAGITASDFRYLRSGNNLVALSKQSMSDSIFVNNFYLNPDSAATINAKSERFSLEFADGGRVADVTTSQLSGVYLDARKITDDFVWYDVWYTLGGYSSKADTLGQYARISGNGFSLGDSKLTNDVLIGSQAGDIFTVQAGDDIVFGLGGHDQFTLLDGNDTVVGGAGNDTVIISGSGTKTIRFSQGDGRDTVDSRLYSTTYFSFEVSGYAIEQITYSRLGDDAIIKFGVDGDALVITDFLNFVEGGFEQIYSGGNIILGSGVTLAAQDIYAGILSGEVAPVAAVDTFYTSGERPIYPSSYNLVSNDIDPEAGDGWGLYVTGVGDGVNGLAYRDSYGLIVFVPDSGFSGLASFSYTVSDYVKTTVGHADVWVSKTYEVVQGGSLTIGSQQLLQNDLDSGNDSFDVLSVSAISGVTVGLDNLTGSILVSANADFIDYGEFQYVITDGVTTRTETATVQVGTLQNQTFTGTSGADEFVGSFGNDTLNGASGNDTLQGGNGNDRLVGGSGLDLMIGGFGDDSYVVDNVGDIVFESANSGTDTVESSISYELSANLENLTLTGSAALIGTGNGKDNLLTGNTGANTLYGGAGNDRLDGKAGADKLWGGLGDDTYVVDSTSDLVYENVDEGVDSVEASVTFSLSANVENLLLTGTSAINGTGNALNNRLTGNSGVNRLDGGAGADTLVGGAGNDIYVVDDLLDVVVELAGQGTDTVETALSYTLGAELENLTLTGTNAVNGTGNAANNVLIGNAAANRLDGGVGNDTMRGGAGDDTYVVDATTDVVTENASEGTDTVESSVTLTLAANVENLVLTGGAAINGTGNTLANSLLGNAGNNRLDGGTGADTLAGGDGNDTYVVDNALDVVLEQADQGVDGVETTLSYVLTANVENLTLTGTAAVNGTGNSLNNTLTGNSGANRLDGGAGADSMAGGSGNDVYVVDNLGDIVTEASSSGGTDTVEASVSWTLGANVEKLTLTGLDNLNGTGNTLANTLQGNAGNNRLDGGTGLDTLIGGAGDDTYVVDVATDVVTENANEGTDTVESSVTLTLGTNLENLVLTGTAALNGTGNALNNLLKGNAGANSLTGAAGNDTLDGQGGADTLTGGVGNDTYLLGRGYGADTVVESDSTAGNTDLAQFAAGIAVDQLWFTKATNNLEVSIIGTTDKLIIKDWYVGSGNHVEQFKTADGRTLLDSQVQNLVNAMASFAPPAQGQTSLPSNYHASLDSVIAANWQ